jgi:hypothetical protein
MCPAPAGNCENARHYPGQVLIPLLAQTQSDDGTLLLGDNLLPLLLLALGGALFVGNVMAVVRPPDKAKDGDLRRAPVGRSLTMAFLGLIAAVWAIATLVG